MFKKTAIAALVLGFSGAASAAMYAPAPAPACAAGNVTVPCEKSAWDLGVDALYMRADDTQFSQTARPKMGWGFALEGSYHFGTGNDVTLNWGHFKKSTDGIVTRTPAVGGAQDRANVESKFDIVNFEFGQHVDFGENVDVRFQGGVQYVSAEDNLYTFEAAAAAANNTTNNFKLTGWGPRAGAKMTYNFGNGFGVYGDGNMALIMGKVETTTAANGGASATATAHGTTLGYDATVGVKYTHAMAQGDLTARLGWGGKHYNAAAGAGVMTWSGVNFGLKWVGNA